MNKPGLNGHESSESPGSAKVLDETLDDMDIKIAVTLDLHGRTTRFASLKVERIVADGLDITEHRLNLRGLREILEDAGKGLRHRIRGKLGTASNEGKTQDTAPAGDGAVERMPNEMIIHIPPPIAGLDSKL